MTAVRVLVVAADPLARAGLATLLAQAAPTIEVVGRTGEQDLAAAIDAHRPEALVWDAGWQPADAIDRLGQLLETGIPVLVLLEESADATSALTSGAHGLLARSAPPEQLAAAILAIHAGLFVAAPDFTPALRVPSRVEGAPSPEPGRALAEPLTPRELEVLQLMAGGLPNKTIAGRLGISEHTVKFHVNAVLGKLGVASRTEAVVTATRLGLILL